MQKHELKIPVLYFHQATDADVGENGRVSYNIVRNAISDVPFFADPINGRIFATREFVNTDPIQFKFTAQAGDNAVNLQNSVATDVIVRFPTVSLLVIYGPFFLTLTLLYFYIKI